MLALIDGDEVAFKASSVSQGKVDWDGDGSVTVSGYPDRAIKAAKEIIDSWVRASKASSVWVILSPRNRSNFRKVILPTYKSQRTGEKPVEYWPVVDWLMSNYDCREAPGIEGDDLLGYYASSIKDSVLCSSDKDMGTVPCRWLRPLKLQAPKPVKVNPKMADWNWMKQTLTGDTADGYKGCPKIGPVKADAILAPVFGSLGLMWRGVVKAYEAAGLDEAAALQQARVARILRYGDMNLEDRVIYLWHPDGIQVPMTMEFE